MSNATQNINPNGVSNAGNVSNDNLSNKVEPTGVEYRDAPDASADNATTSGVLSTDPTNLNRTADGEVTNPESLKNINPNGVSTADSAPNNTAGITNTQSILSTDPTNLNHAAGNAVVEDSVTHQAGEGMTAGKAPATETPDIFDNRPQAAVKTQNVETQPSNDPLQVMPQHGEAISETRSYPLESTSEGHVDHLDRLSDGTYDVPREHDEY
ncbi:hypothetical protein [Faucicola atlantae]|uniref:hypothetical protein n=1 Tax=Faucicola atlantae TaxID=34059 RepID=UPI0009F50736|nr:hypothetical protein [Moraxella atlantae]